MYVHVCACACACVCVCVCACVRVYVCVCTHARTHTHTHTNTHKHTHTHTHTHTQHVCVCLCVCVCTGRSLGTRQPAQAGRVVGEVGNERRGGLAEEEEREADLKGWDSMLHVVDLGQAQTLKSTWFRYFTWFTSQKYLV